MAIYIIGYTLIALAVIFVIFVELVSHRVIFKNSSKIQMIFGHPLLRYSIKRIFSAIISIVLAVIATTILIRMKVESNNSLSFCQGVISNWAKLPDEIRWEQCAQIKANLGMTNNWFLDLLRYFYYVLPFPKTVCASYYDSEASAVIYTNCRNTIMYLGQAFFIKGSTGEYVTDLIFSKMGVSFKVGIIGVLIEVGLGYPMGMLMARRKDGVFDRIGNAYIISIDAIPGVAYYYLWMIILCVLLGLPRQYGTAPTGILSFLASAPEEVINFISILPAALTMGFTGMAGIALWVRRYMLDEFNADYVKFARAKGLSENRILGIHVLRNAIVPLVRSIPAAILGALLGAFFLEKIYAIQGFGILAYIVETSVELDVYVLQGIVIITALISVISYLFGDIITAIIDPRVSFSEE